MRPLLRWLVRVLMRVEVRGDLRVLRNGRSLVVANHASLFDGVLLGLFLPGRPTVVVTAEALGHPVVRFFRRAVRLVVLDERPLALKRLVRQVQRGETVAIFPEGRVTTTGTVMKVYDSAGLIAAHAEAQIVPVHIRGTLFSRFAAVGGDWPRRWLPRVILTVQPPVTVRPPASADPHERRRHYASEMLRVLQQMAFDARPRRTLAEALVDAAATYGGRGRPIIEDDAFEPLTYRALLKRMFALMRLVAQASSEGEIVGVMLPNRAGTVALIFALTARRRVAAILNYSAGPENVHAACVAAGVTQVITSRQFIQRAQLDATVRALHGIHLVYAEDLRKRVRLTDKLWVVRALIAPRSAIPRQDPEATAVVLFTSGSEARPKGVAISHAAMLSNMEQMRSIIDFGPNDKFFNALPLYHTYGLTACTLMPLVTGTPLFLYLTPLRYRQIPELVYTRDCTYLFGTSTFLGNYARQAHDYDFRSVRVVVSGGERLSPDVEQLWLEKFGLRIMEGYGATECGPTITLNTPLTYRRGTVGRLLPRTECRVVPIPGIDRGGALHVRAPQLMSGYYFYDRPGELHPPRSEVGEGWYNTGDVVEIDADGFVTMLGRVKRFAKIAGEMVPLELIERIAYTASPGHKHAATVEQAKAGESTVLFTTDALLDRLVLVKAARQIGAQELAVPRRIVKVASLPLLGSGKTDYVTLNRMTTPPERTP